MNIVLVKKSLFILSVFILLIITLNYFLNLCRGNSDCSKYSITGAALIRLDSGIKLYTKTKGKLPISLDILDSVPLSKVDPWDNNMIYKILNEKEYELYSKGKNGVDDFGLNDDIKIKGSRKAKVYCPENLKR